MKKIALATIAFSALLQSCGNHNKAVDSGHYKNTIKLGKFNDSVDNSTFDESKLADLPRVVDLKSEMSPIKNQSDRGACTFFSAAAMIEAAVKKDMSLNINLSEEFMSYATKSMGFVSYDEGSNVLYNISAVKASGLLLERDLAYQPTWFSAGLPCEKFKDSDPSAPARCFSHDAPDAETMKKVIKTDNLEFVSIEKDTNEIIRYLAKEKRPLTMGIVVNFNGWPQTGDVFYNEDLRKECNDEPEKCGGHSVLLTGYDLDKKVFFFKNSWGTEWGHEGYGTMPIETLDLYSNPDFYSVRLTNKLAIPFDYNVDPLKLKNFSYTTSSDLKKKITVNVAAEVSGARGHLIYLSSWIAKKKEGVTEAANDQNTEMIPLSPEEKEATGETAMRAIKYITAPTGNTLAWTAKAPLALTFLPGIDKTYYATINSPEETLLRTTIYVHTDDSTFKVLKRIYTPIAK